MCYAGGFCYYLKKVDLKKYVINNKNHQKMSNFEKNQIFHFSICNIFDVGFNNILKISLGS